MIWLLALALVPATNFKGVQLYKKKGKKTRTTNKKAEAEKKPIVARWPR